jgi:hypothetical protein
VRALGSSPLEIRGHTIERLHIYIHFPYQFFESRPEQPQKRMQPTQVLKRDVLGYHFKGDARPDNVVALQFDVQAWTEHLISFNTKFSRLNNAMRMQLADSFLEIFSSMRELQVSFKNVHKM